jgi:hypothetical protein
MSVSEEYKLTYNFFPGCSVLIKKGTEDYTGYYAGTKAEIVKVEEVYCVVEGFDGNQFIIPNEYLISFESYKFINCECGAKHTSNPDYHMFFCPMYKE